MRIKGQILKLLAKEAEWQENSMALQEEGHLLIVNIVNKCFSSTCYVYKLLE